MIVLTQTDINRLMQMLQEIRYREARPIIDLLTECAGRTMMAPPPEAAKTVPNGKPDPGDGPAPCA